MSQLNRYTSYLITDMRTYLNVSDVNALHLGLIVIIVNFYIFQRDYITLIGWESMLPLLCWCEHF